jgi:hypothetical protein
MMDRSAAGSRVGGRCSRTGRHCEAKPFIRVTAQRVFREARAVIGAACVLAVLQQATQSHARVQELVSSGVSSLVDGLPAFGDPIFMWTTTPPCHDFGQAGDENQPALITRASLTIASPRAIFSYNPPRAVGVCNPYRLLSNVYAFGGDLYYIDNLGDGGRPALWRRPTGLRAHASGRWGRSV